LCNDAFLDFVEGNANGYTTIVKTAGFSKDVSQRRNREIRVAVLDQ
jgi:hypothetical protein